MIMREGLFVKSPSRALLKNFIYDIYLLFIALQYNLLLTIHKTVGGVVLGAPQSVDLYFSYIFYNESFLKMGFIIIKRICVLTIP